MYDTSATYPDAAETEYLKIGQGDLIKGEGIGDKGLVRKRWYWIFF